MLALAGVAALFCFLRLADLIAALVVVRILLQYLVQAVGVIVLRIRRPDMPRPFRMWLYPRAGAGRGGELHFYPGFAHGISAGDSLRRSDPRGRNCGLLYAGLAAAGVAVRSLDGNLSYK